MGHDKLLSLLGLAFDAGYTGSYETKDEAIERLLKSNNVRSGEEFRVWHAAELRSLPQGCVFQHVGRGRCHVVVRGDGTKFMQFVTGAPVEFNNDLDPWDKAMRLLYRPI